METTSNWFTPSPRPTITRTQDQVARIRYHEYRRFGIVHPQFTLICPNVNGSDVFTWDNALYLGDIGTGKVTLLCERR